MFIFTFNETDWNFAFFTKKTLIGKINHNEDKITNEIKMKRIKFRFFSPWIPFIFTVFKRVEHVYNAREQNRGFWINQEI